MSFEAALAGNRPPSIVGDVRLRYDQSLLIGESRRAGSLQVAPEAAFIAGMGAAAATISVVVMPQDATSTPLAIAFALLSGVLLIGAAILERRSRRPRRFILNFATETLRLEASAILGRRTTLVPFDSVTDLRLEPTRGGLQALVVSFQPTRRRAGQFVLVDRIGRADEAGVERTFRLLKGAFGLGARPPPDSAPEEPEDRFDG